MQDVLQRTFLGNSASTWLTALSVGVVVFLFILVLKRLLIRWVRKSAEQDGVRFNDFFATVFSQVWASTPLALGLYFGSLFLTLSEAVAHGLWIVVLFAILAQAGIWASAGVKFWVALEVGRRSALGASAATTLGVVGFFIRMAVWVVVLLFALDNAGVNITGLVAGLGVGGVAVALALQSVLGDLFASLSIILDKPFLPGDFIVVDGFLGTVEHTGLKTTRLRALSGEQLIFSNADLLQSRVRNFKRMRERRIEFRFRVALRTPAEKLERISGMVRKCITEIEGVRCDRVHFKEFGDSAFIYECVYIVLDPDYNAYMDIQERINLAIVRSLDSEGISLGVPMLSVYRPDAGVINAGPENK